MNLSAAEVERCVVSGVKAANAAYEKISNEWVSDRGVESLVAYFVARQLHREFSKKGRVNVVLEASIREMEKHYLEKRKIKGFRGRYLSPRNRIDITLLRRISAQDWNALGFIELKRNCDFDGWKNDVKRVAAIVHRCGGGDLQFGCFAAFGHERQGKGEWLVATEKDVLRFMRAEKTKWSNIRLVPFRRRLSKWVISDFDGHRCRYSIFGGVYTFEQH